MSVAAVPIQLVVPADGRVSPGAQPVAVTAAGRYDVAQQVLVPGREQGGVPATYVVTPLVPAPGQGGTAVLVVRGWVPSGEVAAGPAALVPPSGDVVLTGWLVPSEPLEASLVDPLTLPQGQVATITAARIVGQLGYPVVDGFVGLVSEEATGNDQPPALPAPVIVTPLPVPEIVPGIRWSLQSLVYAVEWWFFGLVVIWMGVQALRLERGRREVGALGPDHAGLHEEHSERDRAGQ